MIRSLVADGAWNRALAAIADAVELSFLHCPARRTKTAIKERVDIAYDTFLELRAECRFTLNRIEDTLGHYVALRLEGAMWSPLKRQTWIPGDPIGFRHYGMENPDPMRATDEYFSDEPIVGPRYLQKTSCGRLKPRT